MTVRVTATQTDRDYQPLVTEHPNAVSFEPVALADSHGALALYLYDTASKRIATYAPGCWVSAEVVVEPESVNAAAEPKAYAHEPECNTIHDGPAACPPPAEPECPCRDHVAARADVETTATAEAVLSETSEPYVSVSVSGNDAEQVLKLVREGLREHRSDYVLRG